MKGTLALIFLAAYAVSDARASILNRGEEEPLFGIKGGKEVHIEQHPYVVSISTRTNKYLGTGALIKGRWVLTSFLEFRSKLPSELVVRVGSDYALDGGATYDVDFVAVNPKYTGSWNYNLVLIKLTDPVKTSADVKTIQLANRLPKEGEMAIVAGYGNTEYTTRRPSGTLRDAKVPYISFKTCSKSYSRAEGFTQSSFCASSKGVGACPYDWGSPLVYNNQVIGVFTGSAADCGSEKFPGVFADVTHMKEWIDDTVGN